MKELSKVQIENFISNGYLILKGVIPYDKIVNVEKTLLFLCKTVKIEAFKQYNHNNLLNNNEFNWSLINLRNRSPHLFGAIYDSMQVSVAMQNLGLFVQDIVAQLLACEVMELMSFNYLFRMDAPHDKRSRLDWHQDFIDYEQQNMSDGITAWMPLVKIDPNNGSIRILPESHMGGKVDGYEISKNVEDQNSLTSHKHKISNEIINKYKKINITAEPGDVGLHNMNLIHSSGYNTSEFIRFVGNGRYFKMTSQDFPQGRVQYQKSLT